MIKRVIFATKIVVEVGVDQVGGGGGRPYVLR